MNLDTMTIAQLKKEITKRKKITCPTVTGKTKAQLITIATNLGVTGSEPSKGGITRHEMLRQIANSTGEPIEAIRKKLAKQSLKRVREIYENSI
jgi:hypothetical protein